MTQLSGKDQFEEETAPSLVPNLTITKLSYSWALGMHTTIVQSRDWICLREEGSLSARLRSHSHKSCTALEGLLVKSLNLTSSAPSSPGS